MTNRIDRIEAKEPAGAVAAHEAKAAAHTKAQVGLGNVQDYGVASTAEAQAGTAANKYMTPALTKAAITEQAGAAVSSHTGDKNNPHGVTKAQVGLGSVQDYGIATTAEAQAGTVANKYMTPATTAAAITQQAGAAVSSHTGNKSNPHGVTKAQVGLGSVNDWGATGATNDASDAKYATAGAVKKAYDLASAALPKNHLPQWVGGYTNMGFESLLSGDALVKSGLYSVSRNVAVGGGHYPYGQHDWSYYLNMTHANQSGYAGQLAISFGGESIGFRSIESGTDLGWKQIYHTGFKPSPADIGAAAASHNHAWGNITGVPVYATRWPTAAEAGAMADGGTYGTVTCSNWIRTIGATGWYNDSYGGGIHMSDTTWVRVYGGKKFHVANADADAINTSGGVYGGGNGNFNDVHIRSDRRLKSNFEPIKNALAKVSQLHGQLYDKAGVREAGLIAQDVQAVQPESVQENKEGMLTIAPAGVVALLVEAVKELRSENIALKARLDQMGA